MFLTEVGFDLGFTLKNRLGGDRISDKHSSLFVRSLSDKEKKFITLTPEFPDFAQVHGGQWMHDSGKEVSVHFKHCFTLSIFLT